MPAAFCFATIFLLYLLVSVLLFLFSHLTPFAPAFMLSVVTRKNLHRLNLKVFISPCWFSCLASHPSHYILKCFLWKSHLSVSFGYSPCFLTKFDLCSLLRVEHTDVLELGQGQHLLFCDLSWTGSSSNWLMYLGTASLNLFPHMWMTNCAIHQK